MKEKKNKNPKDIEKRKAKAKKIIFFILHGISYILSIMFIGALLIGGCSQKANTYKSANAVYQNDIVTDINSINLTSKDTYKYQLSSSNPDINLPSINVIGQYLDLSSTIDGSYLGSFDINYDSLISKSGNNVFTKLSFNDSQISIYGGQVNSNSLLPQSYHIPLFRYDYDLGRFITITDGVYYDISSLPYRILRNCPYEYVYSEFFDGTISILNYSSISQFDFNDTEDNLCRFLCYYFSQYSLLNANARINNDLTYYYNRVLVRGQLTTGFDFGGSSLSSDNIDTVFVVGDFSYGGNLYDSIYIQCKKFGVDVGYIDAGSGIKEYSYYRATFYPNYNLYYINYVAFYNSVTGVKFNYIVPNLINYNNGLCLSGYSYKINPSFQLVRIHNLAAYNDANDTIIFSGSGRVEDTKLTRSQILVILNYSSDYNGSTGESLINVFDLISTAFSGLGGLLGIAILPSLTIGTLLAIPLTMVLVLFIIKLFKR